MKGRFWLILLVGVATSLPSAPSTAAWGTGTGRADSWPGRRGLAGQRQCDRRFELQVTGRLRGGGDDEPPIPESAAPLSPSGVGEGGFFDRLKGSLSKMMCMMPQEHGQDCRSLATSSEDEEDEREHIRFAAVASEAVWRSREAVALAAAARKANEASIALAEVS